MSRKHNATRRPQYITVLVHCTILASMTTSEAPKAPSFRKLAKEHALAAHNIVDQSDGPLRDEMLDLAQLHALVSLACSEVAPPERRACTTRQVDLTPPAVK